ncbi:hypothetical protein [Thiorhodococcus drewsii]|uniref:hypothetical protein n=1 Tax=Thiorhodococcus drewsii TaxID=210408 RepID=UPI001FDED70C|nr:hypothetical protein [Thiorhodococcus drewsii]
MADHVFGDGFHGAVQGQEGRTLALLISLEFVHLIPQPLHGPRKTNDDHQTEGREHKCHTPQNKHHRRGNVYAGHHAGSTTGLSALATFEVRRSNVLIDDAQTASPLFVRPVARFGDTRLSEFSRAVF